MVQYEQMSYFEIKTLKKFNTMAVTRETKTQVNIKSKEIFNILKHADSLSPRVFRHKLLNMKQTSVWTDNGSKCNGLALSSC